MRSPPALLPLLALLALCIAPLASCVDAEAEVPKALSVEVVTHAGSAWVVGSWHVAAVTDGKGALTALASWIVTVGDSTGHALSTTATRDSFPLTTAVGVAQSGTFCVAAKRRALYSTAACKSWSYTESDSPPPGPVLDSAWVRQALLDSKLIDTALIALTTGETCPAELRDYHRAMLVAPRAGVAQSTTCATVFAEDVAQDNLRTLTSLAAGYPWTATQDSSWRADTTTRPSLPSVYLNTRAIANPMSGDTLVFGAGTETNVPIATYRARHPGFAWPSGT